MEKEIRKQRPTKIGTVVSAGKMDKTITVAVVSSRKHKLYKKVVKRTNKFKVHDEENKAKIGDTVLIMETRHISKDKYYRLVKILEEAK